MPSDHHVPGTRRNPEPMEKDFDELTDDEQRQVLNNEVMMWQRYGMSTENVPHKIFEMDAQLIAVIQVLTSELGVEADTLNRAYRKVMFEKLTKIRTDHLKKGGKNLIVPGRNIEL
jgi:hypothetical protein